MPKKRKKKTTWRPNYTATEKDLLTFGQWVLVAAFICLTIAAIITLDTMLVRYDIALGILLAYLVHKKWFSI